MLGKLVMYPRKFGKFIKCPSVFVMLLTWNSKTEHFVAELSLCCVDFIVIRPLVHDQEMEITENFQ